MIKYQQLLAFLLSHYHTGQCKSTGGCYNELVVAYFSTGGGVNWGVCTFAQARLSLRNSTKISCAGSDVDLCTMYVNSECCGESAPATTAHLCNHQCVVSMRQKMLPVRCNKIPQ